MVSDDDSLRNRTSMGRDQAPDVVELLVDSGKAQVTARLLSSKKNVVLVP
jgi:hypothetical protein